MPLFLDTSKAFLHVLHVMDLGIGYIWNYNIQPNSTITKLKTAQIWDILEGSL